MSENSGMLGGESGVVEVSPETAVTGGAVEVPTKLDLRVTITDAGPCRKHVQVTIPRADVDRRYSEAVNDLMTSATVPGFRSGHVPRKLVEKRFRKDVEGHVRQRLLMESLDQLSAGYNLDPINEPDLDIDALSIPEEGDFAYEFNVEVRPEFELPNYKGLTIRRPVRTVTDEDYAAFRDRYLSQYSRALPVDRPAQPGDLLVLNIACKSGDQNLARHEGRQVRLRPTLRFRDAEVTGFDALLTGATVGETRTATTQISVEASQVELRNEPVEIAFTVVDIQTQVLPELTPEFLRETLGVDSEEEFRDLSRNVLQRQVEYDQRQSTRRQVLDQITASAAWELPESLVRRQVENAMYRELLEMQQAGFTDSEIRSRENMLRQRQVSMTRQALKEHFVLDKLADQEKITVEPDDIDREIFNMSMQRGESPRKVRARLERQGLMENLRAQIRERKAVDFILGQAHFEDVPADPLVDVSAEALAVSVCGSEAPSTAVQPVGSLEAKSDASTKSLSEKVNAEKDTKK